MEWFCGNCCRERIEQQRYQRELTEDLLTAIQYKPPHIDDIRPTIQACPDIVRERDVFDNLPIHTACSNGASLEVIQCLAEAWPGSLQTTGSEQDFPLHLASVISADLEILQYLGNKWKGAFMAPNKRHKRPLHIICARQPKLQVVEYMVQACPEALVTKDKSRDIPLHVACSHKASVEAVRILVQANPATVRTRNMRGDLPLHAACGARACLPVVQLLVQAGPGTLELANNRGDCPLHYACTTGASDHLVAFLIDRGPAVVEHANAKGELPIHVACANQADPVMIRQLIQNAPATLGVGDRDGNLPLHLACIENAPLTTIMILLDTLPEVIRTTNSNGNLPLHQACSARKVSLEHVHYLLEMWNKVLPLQTTTGDTEEQILVQEKYAQGATVTNREGDTPLHLACFHNAPLAVIELLKELWPGALLVQNNGGLTPLQRAEQPYRGVPCWDSIKYMVKEVSKRVFAVCRLVDINIPHLKQLLKVHPKVVRERNPQGLLAIHYLLSRECPSFEAIKLLIEAWPDSLLIGDKHGNQPLHYACRNFPPPSHHARHQLACQTVLFLIHSFTASEVNKAQELPLHVACAQPHATIEIIQALVYAHPVSVTVPNRRGHVAWQIAQQAGSPVSTVRWLQDRTEAILVAAREEP